MGNSSSPNRKNIPANALWDTGSSLSLITKKLAESLKLRGKTVFISFDTVGGQQSFESIEYTIAVIDCSGKLIEIVVEQVEKISSQLNDIDQSIVDALFPEFRGSIQYPLKGDIQLLIGMRYAAFQPVRVKANEHLLVMENQFGMLVAGWHESFNGQLSMDPSVLHMRHGVVMHVTGSVERFFEIEGLGVSCQPECGGCKCGKCHPGGMNMSLEEEREYKVMKSGITFNESTGRFIAKYPWKENRTSLIYNESMAFAVLKSTEKQLKKKGDEYVEFYSSQINDMLNRKAARRITAEELRDFKGQKYFLTHLGVEKPNSKSTPLRIVFNSSARFKGYSVNDCSMKGPSLLNSLYGVLLRFSAEAYAFVGDLSKMYHSIDIPLDDQMMHLFLWRDCNDNIRPQTYAMTVLNMGNKPSSAISQICLREAAKESSEQYPESCKIISDNSYMDDILGSVATADERDALTEEITKILRAKGFHIKEWIMNTNKSDTSNTNNTSHCYSSVEICMQDENTPFIENVLGYQWNISGDKWEFTVSIPDNHGQTTRRSILKVLNGFYDPLGLISPFIVIGKIILRTVYAEEPKLGWDDPIPPHIEREWKKFVLQIPELSTLSFRRSITPSDAIGKPQLIIFTDGAKAAYGAVAYARWKVEGEFVSRLITAKNRVAPLKIENIVRLELCGALIGARVRKVVSEELKQIEFEKVIHIVDSEIVHGMVNKESYGFNTFAGNRLGEIQRICSPRDFFWAPGRLNISDIITRGCPPAHLGEGSEWQNAPGFLKEDEKLWPVKHEVSQNIELPERKKIHGFVGLIQVADSISTRIDHLRFSRWCILVNTTARVLKLYQRFKQGGDNNPKLCHTDIQIAEKFWIREAQKGLDIQSKRLRKLHPQKDKDNIIVVGGRIERWYEATWNDQFFIVLPGKHHISLLIARYEHAVGGHLGRDATISKIRAKYWILGIRVLVESIIEKCTLCKEKLQKMQQQQMAPLPVERLLLKPSPGFTYVMIDYFGPFEVSGEVQKRIRGKCYGVIITCLGTRAIYVDITADYSTPGFLMALRRFASIRGWPTKIFSDPGSQLKGAANELTKVVEDLDWDQIEEETNRRGKGTEWKFSPADAPWYNGAVEALVKSTKRALHVAIGDNVLKPLELQTVMFEAAQLVNQRPIGCHPTNPSDGVYMSPNDLLLGRSTPAIPQGPFKERCSNRYRFDFIQMTVESFWKRWMIEVFPNLVVRPKWHTEQRNLLVGDIVLLQDSNALRGKWKKAIVTEANPSEDGKVRHVKIRYQTKDNTNITLDRPVQRLILLVPADNSE